MSRAGFGGALVLMSAIWAGLQTVLGVALLEALASRAAPAFIALIVLVVLGRLAFGWWRRRSPAVTVGA